ncbi:hypothetical protein [Halalkalibacter flavus]|uniref:hypothetical protein n=1 Tax=Halalkalibacter flavus TaxID=3090668 RepID=UPI002FC680B1
MTYDIERLREISDKTREISAQMVDRDYENDSERLKHALDYVCRSLGMFADVESQRLSGEVVTHDPLKYIQNNLDASYELTLNPVKDGKRQPRREVIRKV